MRYASLMHGNSIVFHRSVRRFDAFDAIDAYRCTMHQRLKFGPRRLLPAP